MKQILDVACGSKMFWFDKNHPDVLFGDIRKEDHILCDGRSLEIKPDIQLDFTDLQFFDNTFRVGVFDPPHLNKLGKNSWMAKNTAFLTRHGKMICHVGLKSVSGF